MQAMKIPSPSFEAKAAKLIGTGAVGGYGELKYLTAMSTTSRTERYKCAHKQQSRAELYRYFKDVNCQGILIALTRGECFKLLYSEEEENTPNLASSEVRMAVRDILQLADRWASFNQTFLHREFFFGKQFH